MSIGPIMPETRSFYKIHLKFHKKCPLRHGSWFAYFNSLVGTPKLLHISLEHLYSGKHDLYVGGYIQYIILHVFQKLESITFRKWYWKLFCKLYFTKLFYFHHTRQIKNEKCENLPSFPRYKCYATDAFHCRITIHIVYL